MTTFELLNQAQKHTQHCPKDAELVDVSDGDHEFRRPTRWVLIGGEHGTMRVRMASGAVADFLPLYNGMLLPISVTAVLQEGTSTTNMWGMF